MTITISNITLAISDRSRATGRVGGTSPNKQEESLYHWPILHSHASSSPNLNLAMTGNRIGSNIGTCLSKTCVGSYEYPLTCIRSAWDSVLTGNYGPILIAGERGVPGWCSRAEDQANTSGPCCEQLTTYTYIRLQWF